eukprot:6702286-Alexandrium_andersonii.AAC.1
MPERCGCRSAGCRTCHQAAAAGCGSWPACHHRRRLQAGRELSCRLRQAAQRRSAPSLGRRAGSAGCAQTD